MTPFTVFGREGCGFCTRAKEVLTSKEIPFKYIDIHKEGISKEDLEKTVGKPVLTVPQIFHGRDHVGGYDQLVEYLATVA